MPATTGAAGSGPVSFASFYTAAIGARCLPCHSTGNGVAVGMLDMSTKLAAFTNLVGASGTGVAASGTGTGSSGTTCASVSGLLRVHPGNAATSLLWQKVNSKLQGTNAPCGNPMPAGAGAALSQAQVDELAAWINGGALDN